MLLKTTPIQIEGICGVISENIVPVMEYCEGLATPKKLRKIIDGTGFESLSISDDDVCTSDMCYQAAEHLFNSGFDKNSIGALIFLSQSGDYRNPATAYILQKRLGLGNDLIVFDIGLGCSGFVYGLYVAASMLSNLAAVTGKDKFLFCCGDVNVRKNRADNIHHDVIFGDAGTCAIISKDNSGIEHTLFNIHSYGERWEALYSKRGGTRYYKDIAAGRLNPHDLNSNGYMDGMAIMDFTLHEVVDNIKELMSAANLGVDDIGAYLFHQPQKLLIKDMAYELKLPAESVIANAQNIGNASSASIPLLLTEIGSAWNERVNKKVLMSGFGVGLSVASVVMDLDNLVCLETKKYERSDV